MTTDGVSGGSKPLTDGGRIPLAGVVLAALPTQASRRLAPANRYKKPTGLSEVGTAVRGVSTLLANESATAMEGSQDRRGQVNLTPIVVGHAATAIRFAAPRKHVRRWPEASVERYRTLSDSYGCVAVISGSVARVFRRTRTPALTGKLKLRSISSFKEAEAWRFAVTFGRLILGCIVC